MSSAASALVVCVGNELVPDDGAGCAVYDRLLNGHLPAFVRLRCLATSGISLIDEFDGEAVLVVVDAVQFGAPPGTLHLRRWDELPMCSGTAVSAHGIGVKEAIEVCTKLFPERTPRDVFLIGIEGTSFDRLGEPMSPAVAAAIEPAANLVKQLLAGYAS